jgi:hypothetical protein
MKNEERAALAKTGGGEMEGEEMMESRLVEYAERIVDLAERRERGECVPTLTDSCTLSQPAMAKEYLALRQERERLDWLTKNADYRCFCNGESTHRVQQPDGSWLYPDRSYPRKGVWVVVRGQRVVADGPTARAAIDAARRS